MPVAARLRVAHVVVSLGVGGAETMLVGTALASRARGDQPIVVCLSERGPLAQPLERAGIRVHDLGARSALGAVYVPWRLARLLRAERIDLVQTWMYHADLLGGLAGRMAHRPVVWGIQSGRMTGAKRTTAALRRVCALVSRRLPAAIICCGNSARQAHLDLGYPTEMAVVPNACDTEAFRPDPDARASVREELGLTDADRVVGMVARVDPLKDHATLLEAMGRVARDRTDAHLVLVGAGTDRANQLLVSQAGAAGLAGRSHLLGQRSDVARLVNGLDVFVLSSRSEGLPLVLAEAMAAGVPCVTTDVGDCAAVVGETGRVVAVGDAHAMATAIGELLDAPAHEVDERRAAARRRAVDRYSLDAAVQEYRAIWCGVLPTTLDSP